MCVWLCFEHPLCLIHEFVVVLIVVHQTMCVWLSCCVELAHKQSFLRVCVDGGCRIHELCTPNHLNSSCSVVCLRFAIDDW